MSGVVGMPAVQGAVLVFASMGCLCESTVVVVMFWTVCSLDLCIINETDVFIVWLQLFVNFSLCFTACMVSEHLSIVRLCGVKIAFCRIFPMMHFWHVVMLLVFCFCITIIVITPLMKLPCCIRELLGNFIMLESDWHVRTMHVQIIVEYVLTIYGSKK